MTPAHRVGICTGRCPHVQPPPYSGSCICLITGISIQDHADADDCPLGWDTSAEVPVVHVRFTPLTVSAKPAPPPPIDWLPIWASLHQHVLSPSTPAFLATFAEKLPFVSCSCKPDWLAWVKANPPDLTSQEAYFEWTWRGHEAINAKLNKPPIPLDAARARWLP